MEKITLKIATNILKNNSGVELDDLLLQADKVRKENAKNQVCIHGIIEFSNYCNAWCTYCGISAENEDIRRYRMPMDEIKNTAIYAVKNLGYKMLVLQSGEDYWFDASRLSWLIESIRKEVKCLIFLSIGNRDLQTYEQLYKAGARGSLFRFETSDAALYKILHPDCSLSNRLEHIRFMTKIGYLVATGPLIGLPGQTIDSLVEDIFLIRDLNVAMASMGPFIPTMNLETNNEEAPKVELILKMIALTRLIYPKVRIPITTAMEKLGGNTIQEKALRGGANAFMLNLTPPDYRKLYKIYEGKTEMQHHAHSKESIKTLSSLINSCGRRVCKGWGTDFTLTNENFEASCELPEERK